MSVVLSKPASGKMAIKDHLNSDAFKQEVARVLNTPEAKERLFSAGVEAAPGTPDELAVYIRSDMSRMGKVIRDAGIRLD